MRKELLIVLPILGLVVSSLAVGLMNSVSAQNLSKLQEAMQGNATTGGNMTGGGMSNATTGGNMTGGNGSSPTMTNST